MSAIFVLLLAFAPEPKVQAEPLDGSRFMLSVKTQALATFHESQAALLPTAKRLCGDRKSFFGAFKFLEQPEQPAAKHVPVANDFQQEIYCSSMERLPQGAATVAPGPSGAQQQAVLAATYGYLAAKDSNRLPEAYAMLSQRAKLTAPEPDWIMKANYFNEQAGAVRARRVTEISWYSDPPEAPEPGVYVAADLSGAFANVEFMCGYLVWRVESDGSLRLAREEQNFLDQRRGAKLAQLDRAPLRAQMGCKD
jgi:hypothetical protein